LLSGTASAAALNPTSECVPSQNGFVFDAPQRQRNAGDFAGSR
jgi:hypothetical protein